MSGYVKLFSDIVDSSIWEQDSQTRVVWVTLLALADQDGYVRGSPGWLAGKARVSEAVCRSALAMFAAPDPRSRTPDNEGRRIEALEDGWLVLNYLAFRERLSSDPKATATRERVRKHRERYNALRNARSVTPARPASASVHASEVIKEPNHGVVHLSPASSSTYEPPAPPDPPEGMAFKMKAKLSELFQRGKEDRWTYMEESLLCQICSRPNVANELSEIIHYRYQNRRFFARSILKLLEDWNGYVDRARNDPEARPKPKEPKPFNEQEIKDVMAKMFAKAKPL